VIAKERLPKAGLKLLLVLVDFEWRRDSHFH
jgi:hypothetical protein